MSFAIELTPAARRQLRKLDPPVRRRVAERINTLADDPRPDGVVKLTAIEPPLYRVREGEWRIVYRIKDDQLLVVIVRVGHRSEIYERQR